MAFCFCSGNVETETNVKSSVESNEIERLKAELNNEKAKNEQLLEEIEELKKENLNMKQSITFNDDEKNAEDFVLPLNFKTFEIQNNDETTALSRFYSLRVAPSARNTGLRCYAEVNVKSLNHNICVIKGVADNTGCDIIAVVKANGYGHGALRICLELFKNGIKTYAVATVTEAIEIRKYDRRLNGKDVSIIVLGAAVPDEYPLYSRYGLDLMLSGPEMTERLIKWSLNRNDKTKMINVHCMLDTGMTRIGFQTQDCLSSIHQLYNDYSNGIKFVGICTHLADAPKERYTLQQFDKFTNVLKQLESSDINVEMFHCENSKSLMADVISDDTVKLYMNPEHDTKVTKGYVRVGGAIYGHLQIDHNHEIYPIISLFAQIRHIAFIKAGTTIGYARSYKLEEDSLIATLAIGYADGYPRGMGNKKKVVRIGDNLYDIAGKVCMDMMMVNLGCPQNKPEIQNISIGDYACLFAPTHDHEKNIVVGDMADDLGAQYSVLEILCGLTKRVPIVYTE